MPKGILVFKWDMKVGMMILGAFPTGLSISEQLKLQIFQMHEYTREAGNISLFNEGISVISYSGGPNVGIYVVLLLFADELEEKYEDAILEFGPIIVEGHRARDFPVFLASQYLRITEFPRLSHEQRLAMIIFDDKKRGIINYLQKSGIISKDDLEIWLKDLYPRETLDINAVFNLLYLEKLIKNVVLEEREMIILLQNVDLIRVPPPKDLIQILGKNDFPTRLYKHYIQDCKNFFQNFQLSQEPTKPLAEILVDPINYKIINFLRKKPLGSAQMQLLRKFSAIDVKKLEHLAALNIVTILNDEKGPIYCLKSDIIACKYFSERILDLCIQNYQLKSLTKKTLIGHLAEIKQFYLAMEKVTKTTNKVNKRRENKMNKRREDVFR